LRILLDNNLDRRLGRELVGHDASHVLDDGWTELKNGELIGKAAAQFDVLVTVDKSMPHQTNLGDLGQSVIVLNVLTNRLADTIGFVPAILDLLPTIRRGKYYVIPRA
jgi:predicted nuclease of predicted toxin-antitoxin system